MIEKRFNTEIVEKNCLENWKSKKVFKFLDEKKTMSFTIMMPPPNITGSLHIGHALTFTLQDILIRFYKKLGFDVLWQAGTDHAGIATEIIVEKELEKKKIKKKTIGRKKFIDEIWKWKKVSGDLIIHQMNRLGTAVDWERSRFTMDSGLSKAVNKVFEKLYNDGVIYKDKRLVNWDPKLQTAISDLEVNQKEVLGKLWFIDYKIADSKDIVTIATTRPETIFADSAIAIHPKNKKLKKYIGKFAIVPIINKKIPIISDEYADPKKGSGAVKITPAHDFNDFKIGKKHNLKPINIFDRNATMNENVPLKYQKLYRFDARKKILLEFQSLKILSGEKENKMYIPVGDRSGEVIEPLLTEQWFCDAKKLCIPIKDLIKDNKINFHPKNWINSFNYWIENIEPWCISRQIWWGHRIPAWYTNDGNVVVAENFEAALKIAKKKYGSKNLTLKQDEDVLDTWFSSALWPFSTLGWPEKTNELEKYYPSNVLVTGFDIIFFWVARMIMMGIYFKKDNPFKHIYIHPLVKDKFGKKMSKSKGNVINPLDLISTYGADAVRFTLVNLSTQGRDIKLSDKLVENSRNFLTKIWNIARFYELNNFQYTGKFYPEKLKLTINHWIYDKFFKLNKKVQKNIKNFQFNFATTNLYQFIWTDFCDLYIEFVKPYLNENENFKEINETFNWIFRNILILCNPFIPFITEEIFKNLKFGKPYYLYNQKFDNLKKVNIDKIKYNNIEKLILFIRDLRSFLEKNKIKTIANLEMFCFNNKKDVQFLIENFLIFNSIFKVKDLVFETKNNENFKLFFTAQLKFGFYIKKNLSDKIYKEKVIFLKKEIDFFNNKLKNKNFLKKAPKKIVEEQIRKLEDATKNLDILEKNYKDNV